MHVAVPLTIFGELPAEDVRSGDHTDVRQQQATCQLPHRGGETTPTGGGGSRG